MNYRPWIYRISLWLPSSVACAGLLDAGQSCMLSNTGNMDLVHDTAIGGGIYFEDNGIVVLDDVAISLNINSKWQVITSGVPHYLDWITQNMGSLLMYDARRRIPEVKVCESGPLQLTLMRLDDMPGKNRWLGNITASDLLLSQRAEFKLELNTPGSIPLIHAWDRTVDTLSVLYVQSRIKNDPSILVSPRDIAYYSDRRFGYTYTVEASDAASANKNHLAFVIEFVEAAAFPIVGRLSILGIEVCPPTTQRRSGKPSCGARARIHEQLITAGISTREGDWPWHGAIFHSLGPQQTYKCGCTLINSNVVLTAAHCVNLGGPGQTIIPGRVFVHLGQHDIDLPTSTTQIFRAHRIIVHPDFEFSTLHNDIALIHLSTEATFTEYVQPICLWDSDRAEQKQVIGRNGIAVGWGFNEFDQLLRTLNQVSMPVVSFADCLTSNPSFFAKLLTANTFCAGFRNGSGVCNGDSGGGMYFEENGIFKIRGVVSLTKSRSSVESACDRREFVVFTDVARYLPWIQQNSQ